MLKRYERNLGALSEEECKTLGSKCVFVAGCGGIGGYVIELLARLGVGTLVACDADVFDETNLNRQLLCEQRLIGKSKAAAAASRVNAINETVRVRSVCENISETNAQRLLSGCDIAVDALDNIESRRVLASACAIAGIPLVHGAVEGWCVQVALIMPGSRTLDTIYPEGAEAKEAATVSFVPSLSASIQAAETVKALLNKGDSLAGRLLCVDMLCGISKVINIG